MRLLIVAYHYPPCTLTPANRVLSWVKYLPQYGIYPIVVTRHWDDDVTHSNYSLKAIDKPLHIEKGDGFEIHRLPHTGNFRTNRPVEVRRWYNRFFIKAFYAFELLLQNVFPQLLGYYNIFTYVKKIAQTQKVDQLLITGSPFQLFKIGYNVNKQMNIPWVADYRDGWSVGGLKRKRNLLEKWMAISDQYHEKKWLSSAKVFTTVSTCILDAITAFVNKKGLVVYNGFFEENRLEPVESKPNTFTIVFNGAIYNGQEYEPFVNVWKKIYRNFANQIQLNCIFVGTSFINLPFANNRVFNGTENFIQRVDRVDYVASQSYYALADVLLMFGFGTSKGQVSSKIFDYIIQEKPIVLFKSDHDILDELVTSSGLGQIANSPEELYQLLAALIQEKLSKGKLSVSANKLYIQQFSRSNQAKAMADVLWQK